MKQTTLLLGLFIIACSLGCKKETNDDVGNDATVHLEAIAGNLSQGFFFNANQGDTITGPQGTRLILNPNTFYFKKDNSPVTGNVNGILLEIYNKGGLIHFNKPTISNGELLLSGGVAMVRFSQNDEEVYSNNSRIQFVATNPNLEMRPFGWKEHEQTWQNYIDADAPPVTDGNNVHRYDFPLPENYTWINCDRFIDNPAPHSKLTITIPNSHKANQSTHSTVVYLILKNQFSVFRVMSVNTEDQFGLNNLPIGEDYSLLALTANNYKVTYDYIPNQTSTSDKTYTLSMKDISNQDLKTLLSNL